MSSFQFSLVSPEKILLDQPVHMAVVPGLEGDIGILGGHAPLLTLLRPGVISIYEDTNNLIKIFVDGGLAEISSERCVVLVTEGIPLEALDKRTLEIQIQNLMEDVAKSVTLKEREIADKNLTIARTKLMEILASGV